MIGERMLKADPTPAQCYHLQNLTPSLLNYWTVNTRQRARGKSVHEWANIGVKRVVKGKRAPPPTPRTASQTAELTGRQRAQMGQYLNGGLHVAVKQLTVKNGARFTLPHSLGFRGESGGPGEMVRGVRWVQGKQWMLMQLVWKYKKKKTQSELCWLSCLCHNNFHFQKHNI